MKTEIEDRLEAVLATAATAAPEPDMQFLSGVRMRVQRRRKRRVLAGVCWVAAAILAGALAPAALPGRPAPVKLPPMPDLLHLSPPEQVWPQAVVELPARLPDGRGYVILRALGHKRYLVRSVETWVQGLYPRLDDNFCCGWTQPVKQGAVEILDTSTGTATVVSARVPEDAQVYASDFGAAWTVVRNSTVEFWAAAIGGSGGTRLLSYPWPAKRDFDGIVVVLRDRIVFEQTAVRNGSRTYYADAPLLSVPLRGGPAAPVPESTGFAISGYPVAGVVGWPGSGPPWVVRPGTMAPGDRDGFPPIVEMWNLATGQRITGRDLRGCAPPWCLPREGIVLRPMNGTGALRVPPGGTAVFMDGSRFVTGFRTGGTPKDTRFIWDISTGEAAALSRLHQRTDDMEVNTIQLDDVTPSRPHHILDLTAIPLSSPARRPNPAGSPSQSRSPGPSHGPSQRPSTGPSPADSRRPSESPGPVDSPSQVDSPSRSPD